MDGEAEGAWGGVFGLIYANNTELNKGVPISTPTTQGFK